jgi:hypothetical protein
MQVVGSNPITTSTKGNVDERVHGSWALLRPNVFNGFIVVVGGAYLIVVRQFILELDGTSCP